MYKVLNKGLIYFYFIMISGFSCTSKVTLLAKNTQINWSIDSTYKIGINLNNRNKYPIEIPHNPIASDFLTFDTSSIGIKISEVNSARKVSCGYTNHLAKQPVDTLVGKESRLIAIFLHGACYSHWGNYKIQYFLKYIVLKKNKRIGKTVLSNDVLYFLK